jgi:nitronate monooxygenase
MTEQETGPGERWRRWLGGLRLPLIAAPMTAVSTPALVAAACASGVIGSFPTHNAGTVDGLRAWLDEIDARTAALAGGTEGDTVAAPAPLAANVVVRRSPRRVEAELAALAERRVPIVIASVGSPAPIVGPLHEAGVLVLADVATLRHAERALEAGADGLVLLTAGAGGQTGWLNGLAFVRAVRQRYDGPIVLAGGVSDGTALWAAEVLGCDAAYMGTRFIATVESGAEPGYKEALVDGTMDDVVLTTPAATGLPANLLSPTPERLRAPHGWSAGHTVSAVSAVRPVADVIAATAGEYAAARTRTERRLRLHP